MSWTINVITLKVCSQDYLVPWQLLNKLEGENLGAE